ncbi:MAG: ABC transporter permease [Bacteroidetes bacterium]|nr:ABC transporter permease [Bacteroidota bacterium]
MRSALTTLGIVIGIVAVTLMSTAIEGLNRAFISSISSFGTDVLYVDKFPWFHGDDWWTYRNRKDIKIEDADILREQMKNAVAVAPNMRTFGRTIKYKDKSVMSTIIYGTTTDFALTNNILPQEGRFLTTLEDRAGRDVCLIGADIARELFTGESPLNKIIKINDHPYKVIGILEKQGQSLFGGFSLDGQVIMPITSFQKNLGQRRTTRIDVKVVSMDKLDDAKEELRGIMRKLRKVPPGKEDDFAINQQEAFLKAYNDTVGVIQIAGLVITFLSLFVGAIGIMNIMFVSVKERTKEIGIRKAIGAKRRTVLAQFLIEAILICLLGGIIGLMIAFPLSLLVDKFLPTAMPLEIVFLSLIISAIVGIISGIVPAWQASKLDPVDALRYE